MEYLLGSETGETSTRKKPAKTATFSSDKRRPVWARPKERRKVSPFFGGQMPFRVVTVVSVKFGPSTNEDMGGPVKCKILKIADADWSIG